MTPEAYRQHVRSMSPEDLRVAVAERLGWRLFPYVVTSDINKHRAHWDWCPPCSEVFVTNAKALPDWPHDIATVIEIAAPLGIGVLPCPYKDGETLYAAGTMQQLCAGDVTVSYSAADALARAYLIATHPDPVAEGGKP